MRQFHTTVVERREDFKTVVETHPFEAAWASEAIFFVRVEEADPGVEVNLRAQISADGLRWIDEGTVHGPLTEPGDSFLRVAHFGGWLRLAGEVSRSAGDGGSDPVANLTIWLALKE